MVDRAGTGPKTAVAFDGFTGPMVTVKVSGSEHAGCDFPALKGEWTVEILRIPDVERQELIARIPGDERRSLKLGTLGPAGTSSEYVAQMMSRSVANGARLRIVLEDTYEACVDALTESRIDLVLVAHAYPGINAFYMHPGLEPAIVFRGSTPSTAWPSGTTTRTARNCSTARPWCPTPLPSRC